MLGKRPAAPWTVMRLLGRSSSSLSPRTPRAPTWRNRVIEMACPGGGTRMGSGQVVGRMIFYAKAGRSAGIEAAWVRWRLEGAGKARARHVADVIAIEEILHLGGAL